MEKLILSHFLDGYNYNEILSFLALNGFELSLSTLKRKFKSLGLKRRNIDIDQPSLREEILKQLIGSGQYLGIYVTIL